MSRKNLCYCAFCRSPKKIYAQKRIGGFEVLACGLIAGALSVLVWGSPDPRGVVIWVMALLFSEAFLQSRWRMSVICTACGFDPVLYKKSPEQASANVKAKLELRRTDPRYLLSKPLQVPTIKASRKTQIEQNPAGKGALVSRSI